MKIIKRLLSIIAMICIACAVSMPLEGAYAEAAGERQSSFEYKQYADQNDYKQALDRKMHRVYSVIGSAIDDEGTIPIPGIVSTYTKTDGKESQFSSYVPQGLCIAGKYMLSTAYHSKKQHRSVLYVVDTETDSLVSTLTLPNRYHLGGVAFDGNNIWLTGDTSDKYEGNPFVQYIRFEDFSRMICEPVYEVGRDEISEPVYIKNKPSFLDCDNGILWVGTYVGKDSGKRGVMNGYKISETEDGPELNTFMYSVITGIDSSAQGADIRGNYLYVSSSYAGAIGAIKSSFVTKYSFFEAKKGDRDIDVSQKELRRVEVPKMNEEIIATDSGIIINFESAADCYKMSVIATDRLLAVSDSVWR